MYRTASVANQLSWHAKESRKKQRTILIDVLEESLELVHAGRSESISFPPIQHPANDRSLDALEEERHRRSRLDKLRQGGERAS